MNFKWDSIIVALVSGIAGFLGSNVLLKTEKIKIEANQLIVKQTYIKNRCNEIKDLHKKMNDHFQAISISRKPDEKNIHLAQLRSKEQTAITYFSKQSYSIYQIEYQNMENKGKSIKVYESSIPAMLGLREELRLCNSIESYLTK